MKEKLYLPQFIIVVFITFLVVSGQTVEAQISDNWVETLTQKIENIDRNTPGNLGVYIKHLGDGQTLNWQGDRVWYLASTVKVPIAIALLEMVEEGKYSLDNRLILQESDFVDGAGDLLWTPPGAEFTLESLMKRMLVQSDNIATDMLIRLIGEDEINRRIVEHMVPEGLNPITTLLQVRYDAYSEIHPNVTQLSNMDIVHIQTERQRDRRFAALMDKLQLGPDDVNAACVETAFEKYYLRNINSGTLSGMGGLLERLVNGDLLSETHTALLLGIMEEVVTGDRRIKAGLPGGIRFAHKTGTQIERACNVGIIQPYSDNAVIIAAVIEGFGPLRNAENVFQQLGAALNEAGLIVK